MRFKPMLDFVDKRYYPFAYRVMLDRQSEQATATESSRARWYAGCLPKTQCATSHVQLTRIDSDIEGSIKISSVIAAPVPNLISRLLQFGKACLTYSITGDSMSIR